MSMINDALRRASSAAKSPASGTVSSEMPVPPPVAGPESVPPLPISPPVLPSVSNPPIFTASNDAVPAPPVMRIGPTQKKSSSFLIVAILFVLCVAGAAGAYLWHKSRGVIVQAVEKAENEMNLDPVVNDRPTNFNIPAHNGNGSETNASIPAASSGRTAAIHVKPGAGPVVIPGTSVAAPLHPVTSVKFPPLRLQSIFYRPSNPSVIINNKTLFVTDEISGVKVADIQPASVTLVLSGQTNILTLR